MNLKGYKSILAPRLFLFSRRNIAHLFEMIVQFDDRSPTKHPLLISDQLPMFY